MEHFKAAGNAAYTARRFAQAVSAYSHAIVASYPLLHDGRADAALNALLSTLHANRAAGWMGLRRWPEARRDCQRAIELHPASEKARTRLANIDKEEAKQNAAASSSAATAAASGECNTAVVSVASPPLPISPSPRLEVRTNLPHGKHSGLFARSSSTSSAGEEQESARPFQAGETLFECTAAAVVLDEQCAGGRRQTVDLLHAVLIAAAIDPLGVGRSLAPLYPSTDEQLLQLPLVSMAESSPEEEDEVARLIDAAQSADPPVHPALVVPPYRRLVALTAGVLSPRQIHLLHHQLLYNSFSLAGVVGGAGDDGFRRAGSGLYPAASLLNHSCWPNAFGAVLPGLGQEQRMVVRALRDIAPGEEVCVAYVQTISPRAARKKLLWETFEFLCRCDRCEGVVAQHAATAALAATGAAPAVVAAKSSSSSSVFDGVRADELLEALVCTNPSCTGLEGTRGQVGCMYRHRAARRSVEEEEAAAEAQAQSADYIRDDSEDVFVCSACKHTEPAQQAEARVAALSAELARVRAAYAQSKSEANGGGGGAGDLEHSFASFRALVSRAEKVVRGPTHWILPQLYSALAGLHFQRSRAVLQQAERDARQLASTAPSSKEAVAAAAARAEAHASKELAESHRLALLSFQASRSVLCPNNVLLVSLLLTCASVVPAAHPARVEYLKDALRIHAINYGGGIDLLRLRYPQDFERMALPQQVLQQLQA
jgi:hypothetical protein